MNAVNSGEQTEEEQRQPSHGAGLHHTTTTMDLTFVLSAIIFTLLAIVVATSVFNGSSSAADFANARSYFGAAGGLDQSGPRQNGHLPEKKKKKTADDWCEISGSSHDHWDVVKSVQSVSGS